MTYYFYIYNQQLQFLVRESFLHKKQIQGTFLTNKYSEILNIIYNGGF